MAEVESLEILIDVVEQFDDELDRLLFKLGEVETAVQAVDPIEIDVDVDDAELDLLHAKLSTLQGMDLSSVGDIDVDVDNDGGQMFSGPDMSGVETRLDNLLTEIGSLDIGGDGGGGGSTVQFEDEGKMREQLNIMTQRMKGLQNTLGDFSDGIDDTVKNMGRTADAADDAADGLLNTNLRMTDLHNALARAVPMLVLFVGTLPAVIAGVAALAGAALSAAAALGALTLFGAIGFAQEIGGGDISEGFSEIVSNLQDDFLDAFEPLFEELAPVFEDGVDGLGRLFEAVAGEGDALVGLADEARDVGQFLIESLPSFLRDVALFADASSDALGLLINRASQFDVFEALANIIVETQPELTIFFGLLADMIGPLIRLSMGFLQVANGVLFLANGFLTLIDIIPFLTEQHIGALIASLLAAVTATFLLNSALLSAAYTALVSLGRSIIALVANLAGYVGASGSAIASTLGLAASMKALAAAIALTGIGALAVIAGAIAGGFASASTKIDEATSSLKDFRSVQDSMGGGGLNPYRNPQVTGTEGTGQSRFANNNVEINVENGDTETMKEQANNAMYRMERTGRK